MATGSSNRILALIPAYNEGARVAFVVRETIPRLPVLVVNDGSTDDTAVYAEFAGATVLHQTPNQGKGAALRAGFRWALELGYDAVITLDADGQHDPAEIPVFLAAYTERGADLVIGERDFRRMPFPRNMSNTIGRWLFSWALGQRVRDNQSGYRLLSRRMMEATLASSEQGFEFEVEMIVTCVQRGYTLAGVPIRTIYGTETSHIKPLHQTIHFMRVVWQTRQRVRTPQGKQRRKRSWVLSLPIAALLALIAALLLTGDNDDTRTPAGSMAQYPTPAPITFIAPTPLPVTPPTAAPPEAGALIGQPVPDFHLALLDGRRADLGELTGRIVFLNFWATWCVPCENEMPLLQQLFDERGENGVLVIAVTDPLEGQTRAQVEEFIARHTITFPVALSSDDALYRQFNVAQIPITYIIDRAGIVRFLHIGELHADDITRYLDRLS